MLSFRTTKEIQVNLHDDSMGIVEFQFSYSRPEEQGGNGMRVIVDAYKVFEDELEFIPLGGKDKKMDGDELKVLMTEAIKITPAVQKESPLEYFDRLVVSGIKLYIITKNLWRSQLTLKNFK